MHYKVYSWQSITAQYICSQKNTIKRLKVNLTRGEWPPATLSFSLSENSILTEMEDTSLRQKRRIWWTERCQVTVSLFLRKFCSRWGQSQCLLSGCAASVHCNMTSSDLPLTGAFPPLLFFFTLLVFMPPPSITAVCYICLLVTLHLSFLPEQSMINAVPPCLQLSQHTDRVG